MKLKLLNSNKIKISNLLFAILFYCVYFRVGGNGTKTRNEPKNIKLAK